MIRSRTILFSLFFTAVLLSPLFAGAVVDPNVGGGGIPNPLKGANSFMDLVTIILQKVVLPLGTTVVIFFIIYSGFLFVTAQGNEEKLTRAKTAFVWTMVGAAVLLGATVFSSLICETIKELGADITCSAR